MLPPKNEEKVQSVSITFVATLTICRKTLLKTIKSWSLVSSAPFLLKYELLSTETEHFIQERQKTSLKTYSVLRFQVH